MRFTMFFKYILYTYYDQWLILEDEQYHIHTEASVPRGSFLPSEGAEQWAIWSFTLFYSNYALRWLMYYLLKEV